MAIRCHERMDRFARAFISLPGSATDFDRVLDLSHVHFKEYCLDDPRLDIRHCLAQRERVMKPQSTYPQSEAQCSQRVAPLHTRSLLDALTPSTTNQPTQPRHTTTTQTQLIDEIRHRRNGGTQQHLNHWDG